VTASGKMQINDLYMHLNTSPPKYGPD